MKKQIALYLFLLLFAGINVVAQNLSQTIKGRILDKESQAPLIGANVYLEGSNPVVATTTNTDGYFKLTGIPVGRQTVSVSYVGYNKISIPEVLVGSGKEVVLNIDLKEEVSNLAEVVVTARKSKGDVMNSMATVSSRSFNVEETRRYAGGLDDPARLASAFAGVSSMGSLESNAIIVRGNAPTGIMWQVEGVEVPVPSHFANADVMGGGAITLFSNQILNNSDFFTGAFPAEYGNASAGVFDVKLRAGNNEKYEHAISVGALGLDVSSEGPFKKGGKASYLFNYRYSTFGLVKQFLPQSGLPVYQDFSFKLNFPTTKAGTFSLWGIGGIDNYTNTAKTDKAEWTDNHARLDLDSWFYPGSAGIGHKILIGSNTNIQSTIAASSYSNKDNTKWMTENLELKPMFNSQYNEFRYTAKTTVNHKFNSRLTLRAGAISNIYTFNNESVYGERIADSIAPQKLLLSNNGNSSSYQLFAQAKFDISSSLSVNGGLHHMYFALNGKTSVEPRFGIRYAISPRHAVGFAYGSHSQMQPLNIYLVQRTTNGITTQPNKGLDFSKAQHFVLSYDFTINENMRLKIEPYYQMLSSLPVEEGTSFALINIQDAYGFDKALVSKGKGTNYGIDFTLERFLNEGFYYLLTASLFDSKYTGGDGVERNTMFNTNYLVNLLAGKEWGIGRNSKNNLLGLSGRLYLRGGDRTNPVDEQASIAKRDVVYDESNAFAKQNPMLYRFDISATYRINRAGVSHVFALQLNNALASPTVYNNIFDFSKNTVREEIDGEPFPSVSWKVEF